MSKKEEYVNKKLDASEPEDFAFLGSREDVAESRTVASRDRLRAKMAEDVENFIKAGGSINCIDSNVLADPPKKPVSNYGGRPI